MSGQLSTGEATLQIVDQYAVEVGCHVTYGCVAVDDRAETSHSILEEEHCRSMKVSGDTVPERRSVSRRNSEDYEREVPRVQARRMEME